jgi:hypothetical protein
LDQQLISPWFIVRARNAGSEFTASNLKLLSCLMNRDKQKVWVALSCWTKDLDEGHRAISWEIVQISKSKDKIAEGIPGFPNQQAQKL